MKAQQVGAERGCWQAPREGNRSLDGDDQRYSRKRLCWGLLVALLAGWLSLQVTAEDTVTTVLYPQVREPFTALYKDYLTGIQDTLPEPAHAYAVNDTANPALIRAIASRPPKVLIALGDKSLSVAQQLGGGQPLVALVTNEKNKDDLAGGILLKPSADVYLDNLQAMHPQVKQVFVVYNPDTDQALIDEADKLATQRGITLAAFGAHTIREAAVEYQKLLRTADTYSAIWLLPDGGLIDTALLSTILDVAWERKLVVFSSNPLFVKYGALFAIYPDNRAVGASLARLTLEIANGEKRPLQLLRDVRLAVNERTLNHLGLTVSPEVRKRIDLMLPGR